MTEKNETPAEHPAETHAPGEEKMRKSWHGCLFAALLLIASLFLGIITLPPLGQPSEHACSVDCFSNLMQDWKILRWGLPFDKEDESWTPPPDWTLVDLIHESEKYTNTYNTDPVFRGCFHIRPQTWIEEIRDIRYAERQHYLVFPVPASLVFDDSLQPPVPIVMCPPGAHRKYGTNVLYSNGDVKTLTLEEAEKLVKELSPVPLEIKKKVDAAARDDGLTDVLQDGAVE